MRNAEKAKRREKIIKYLISLKEKNPCTDCRQYYSYYVMDWDHIPDKGVKIDRLANMVYRCSLKKIMEEIAKCELVCSNCHRVRTFRRASKEATEKQEVSNDWFKYIN